LLLVLDGIVVCGRHHESLLDPWIDGLCASGKTAYEPGLEQIQQNDGHRAYLFWVSPIAE
jgi:hypothetical protein